MTVTGRSHGGSDEGLETSEVVEVLAWASVAIDRARHRRYHTKNICQCPLFNGSSRFRRYWKIRPYRHVLWPGEKTT